MAPWHGWLIVSLFNWFWTQEERAATAAATKVMKKCPNDAPVWYESDGEPVDEDLSPLAVFSPATRKLTTLRIHIPPDLPTSLPSGLSTRTGFGLDEIHDPDMFVIGNHAAKDLLFLLSRNLILKCEPSGLCVFVCLFFRPFGFC
jgi:hypothetical protein